PNNSWSEITPAPPFPSAPNPAPLHSGLSLPARTNDWAIHEGPAVLTWQSPPIPHPAAREAARLTGAQNRENLHHFHCDPSNRTPPTKYPPAESPDHRHCPQNVTSPHRDWHSQASTEERQYKILSQHNTGDAPRARTERPSDHHFMLARASARQHQIRRVPANSHHHQQHYHLQ